MAEGGRVEKASFFDSLQKANNENKNSLSHLMQHQQPRGYRKCPDTFSLKVLFHLRRLKSFDHSALGIWSQDLNHHGNTAMIMPHFISWNRSLLQGKKKKFSDSS